MDTVYIYGLYDPRNDELRYIGRTINLENRLRDHITASRGKKGQGYNYNPPKEKWIRGLLKENLLPIIKVIEECNEENWEELEKEHIKKAREIGHNLTNISSGGDGFGAKENHPRFGKKLTEEHRRKCSVASTGKIPSEEARRKISESKKGKKLSDYHRKRISEAHAHLTGSDNPFYGKHHTEETKRKISKANKGKPGLKGRVFSEETILKMRNAPHKRKQRKYYLSDMIF